MDGIKRNLRYWGRVMENMVFIVILTMAILNLVYATEDIFLIPRQLLRMCAASLTLFGMYAGAMIGIGSDSSISFALSMGSTRRDTFIGMETMLHLLGIELFAISQIAWLLLPTEDKGNQQMIMLGSITCIFLAAFFGNITAAIRLKWQNGIDIFLCIVILICSMAGLLVSIGLNAEWLFSILTKGWMIALSIVLDVVTGLLCFRGVKKAEVRL